MTQSWQPKDIAGVPNGLILFDGVCVLCSGWVRFVLERDRDGWFCFTPIQSPYGRALAQRLGIDLENPQTNAVVVRGRAHFKFDTVIAILERLPRWHWARALALMPRGLRTFIYDRVAQNRYRWFGRTESCMMPRPEVTARFVHDTPSAAATPTLPNRESPFEVLLGADFARLPAALHCVHATSVSLHSAGRADIRSAAGLVPRLLCWAAGLPTAGIDIPVTVDFHPDGRHRQFWQRRFGDRRYASTIRVDAARAPGLLVEHFGVSDLEFKLTARDGGLAWSVQGWRIFGVRLPRWTTPRIECFESADGDCFVFDIDVAFPLVGHVIHYRGWLLPE